jgi:hypothetical protein
MPIPRLALALAAAPLLIAAPGVARACSVAADYRVPSNLELAAGANTIVLGQVVGAAEALAEPGEALSGAIEVRPLATLKGLTPGGALLLPGMALAAADAAAPAAEEIDFAAPHPEALAGACIRRTFAPGATVLFFLAREDGGWAPAGGAFSRWAEDVSGPADPWVQLATLYVRAAQAAPAERAALLEDQLEALQARIAAGVNLPGDRSADPVVAAMATDLERTMAAPGFPQIIEREPGPAAPAAPGEDLGELGEGIDALAQDPR